MSLPHETTDHFPRALQNYIHAAGFELEQSENLDRNDISEPGPFPCKINFRGICTGASACLRLFDFYAQAIGFERPVESTTGSY
jgi:hypothetical protein